MTLSQTIDRPNYFSSFGRRMLCSNSHLLDVFLADAGFLNDSADAQLHAYDREGLALWLAQAIRPGTQLQVGIPNGHRPEEWDVIYWVKVEVHACRRDHLGWLVDCHFLDAPAESLFNLLDELTSD